MVFDQSTLQSLFGLIDYTNNRTQKDNAFFPEEEVLKKVSVAIANTGTDKEKLYKELKNIVDTTPSTHNSTFFNQLFGGASDIAVIGDIITCILNNSMYTYKVAGSQVLIENEVISHSLQQVGFDNGEGIFCSGGSMSNLVGMLLARNNITGLDFRNSGSDGKNYIVYTSEESHYSITKNAGIIGSGRHNVRKVSVDKEGKMDPKHLKSLIEKDIAEGNIPYCLNLTAGTTVFGAYDSIIENSVVAKAYDIWVHVDGAFGGSVILSSEHKNLLKGISEVDSFTWDFHKVLGVPLLSSVLLTKHSGLLHASLSEVSDYLFQGDEDRLNPGLKTLQCGRRNDALKIWMLWKHLGDTGMNKKLNCLFKLRDVAVDYINKSEKFNLVSTPEYLNVCFTYSGVEPDKVCEYLDKSGLLKLGYGNRSGLNFFRLVCVNDGLSIHNIIDMFQLLEEACEALKKTDS